MKLNPISKRTVNPDGKYQSKKKNRRRDKSLQSVFKRRPHIFYGVLGGFLREMLSSSVFLFLFAWVSILLLFFVSVGGVKFLLLFPVSSLFFLYFPQLALRAFCSIWFRKRNHVRVHIFYSETMTARKDNEGTCSSQNFSLHKKIRANLGSSGKVMQITHPEFIHFSWRCHLVISAHDPRRFFSV